MKLYKITKENVEEFTGLIDEILIRDDLVVGVGCLDEEENPIGAALLESDGDRLIISSLFVEEGSRRKGAGSLMLEGIIEMSEVAGTESVEAYFMGEEAESFFIKNNFLVAECAPVYRVKAGLFTNLPSIDKQGKISGHVVCLGKADKRVKEKLYMMLSEMGYLSRPDLYDQELSFVYTDKKDNPVTFVLTDHQMEEGVLRVEHLINMETDHPEYALSILNVAIKTIKEKGISPDTEVEFVSMNEKVYKFIEKIADGKEKITDCGKLLHAVH